MEQNLFALGLASAGASALQSTTGIGFGVIAGPVLLVVLNDGSAIHISIILNLMIALIVAPPLRRKVDRRLLVQFLIGSAIGAPLGLVIYLSMNISLLKAFAGFVVLFTLFFVLRSHRAFSPTAEQTFSKFEKVSIGAVAGVMGGSLAMPGPIPAAWMSARGYKKETIRATILLMFVFAYMAALALQFVFVGISAETLRLCIILAPSTIAGTLVGGFLSTRISDQIFHWLLVSILMATAIMLFSTLG